MQLFFVLANNFWTVRSKSKNNEDGFIGTVAGFASRDVPPFFLKQQQQLSTNEIQITLLSNHTFDAKLFVFATLPFPNIAFNCHNCNYVVHNPSTNQCW